MPERATRCSAGCGRERDGRHPYCSACRSAYHFEKVRKQPEAARLVRTGAGR